jgi:hypothetical protein
MTSVLDLFVFFAELFALGLLVSVLALTLFVVVAWVENAGGMTVRDRQDRW